MRNLVCAAVAGLALATLAGCGDDGPETAADTSGTADGSPSSEDTGSDGSTGGTSDGPATAPTGPPYPAFGEENYSYVLEQICFCPLAGPIRITVEDGEVTEAVTARDTRGFPAGSDAPEYARRTIDDLIEEANRLEPERAAVVWPAGHAWPSRIELDPIERAVDDEVTYVIRRVETTG